MTPIRCLACGQGAWHRPGARYCTACAAPIAEACAGCGQDVLLGDRFCAFCAKAVSPDARPGAWAEQAASAAPGAPAAGNAAQAASLPPDEVAVLQQLAEAAQARAAAADPRTPVPAKRHLDQRDIDALFG